LNNGLLRFAKQPSDRGHIRSPEFPQRDKDRFQTLCRNNLFADLFGQCAVVVPAFEQSSNCPFKGKFGPPLKGIAGQAIIRIWQNVEKRIP